MVQVVTVDVPAEVPDADVPETVLTVVAKHDSEWATPVRIIGVERMATDGLVRLAEAIEGLTDLAARIASNIPAPVQRRGR